MTDKPLRELVCPEVVGVPPDADWELVRQVMLERRISCVVVLEQGRPLGIVTERAVLLAVARPGASLPHCPVREIMTSPVTTIGQDRFLFEAYDLIIAQGLRHLVVVDEGGLARGVITQSDILRGLEPRHIRTLRQRLEEQDAQLAEAKQKLADKTRDLDEMNQGLEQLVVERTSDLAAKARELSMANERLRSLNELKSSFLSSVSHELRTPLTSLLGFAKLIDKDFARSFQPLAGENELLGLKARRISQNLGIIVSEGERLTRLINDFLDLSRIEAGRMDWHDADVAVPDCVERAVDAVSGLFESKPDLRLTVQMDDCLPRLRLDPDRLEQVLINLLDNAGKYTDHGVVDLCATQDGEAVLFRVNDSGPGIGARELDGIFDKFCRGLDDDTVRDKPKGTGLGLAICKEIVEHYGGRIWADSTPGRGSSFAFWLPVRPGHLANALPDIAGDNDRPMILVVDDDPAICSYLIQFFEAEGFGVAAARDGRSAIEAARNLRPDLITMDLLLPDMNGRQAMAEMQKDPALAGIPVLIISVLAGNDLDTPAQAQAALEKPIDEHLLMETVSALLTRRLRKRLIPVLRRHFPKDDSHGYTLLMGDLTRCNVDELWERVDSGFEGTIILPDTVVADMDLRRLKDRPGIQILIMPEESVTA